MNLPGVQAATLVCQPIRFVTAARLAAGCNILSTFPLTVLICVVYLSPAVNIFILGALCSRVGS